MATAVSPPVIDQPSPLLRLPAELRIQIYSYLLTSPQIPSLRRLAARNYLSTSILPGPAVHANILATCRQIYYEATPILYGENSFAAHPQLLTKMPYLVNKSKPVAQSSAARRIRRWTLSLRLDTDPLFTLEDATRAFSGAEELDIDVWQAQFEACDYSVLRLFEGVRGVSRVSVKGSVERGFASWMELVMMTDEDDEEEKKSGTNTPAYVEGDGEDGRRVGRGPGGLDLWAHVMKH